MEHTIPSWFMVEDKLPDEKGVYLVYYKMHHRNKRSGQRYYDVCLSRFEDGVFTRKDSELWEPIAWSFMPPWAGFMTDFYDQIDNFQSVKA